MQQILQTIQVMIRPDSRSASAVGESRLGVSVQESFKVPGMGWSAHNLDSTWHVQPVWEKTNFRFCIFVHTCTSLIIYVTVMQCRLRHCECVFVRQWNEVTHAVTKRFVENDYGSLIIACTKACTHHWCKIVFFEKNERTWGFWLSGIGGGGGRRRRRSISIGKP